MIDFHTHILPGIDDGSRDMDMSLDMLKMECAQGVDKIVLTPHFYAQQDNLQHFLDRRQIVYDSLKNALEKEQPIDNLQLRVGAEVYYFTGMGNSDQIHKLCVENSQILMLEMPFEQWTKEVLYDVNKLIDRQKLTVVLVHIERFFRYQKDMTVWNNIMSLPIVYQVNLDSFIDWKKRRFVGRFIREGHEVILGTDAHNITSRAVNFAKGTEAVIGKFGNVVLDEMNEIARKLWKNG